MGCCQKIKHVAGKARNIVAGNVRVLRGKKFEFTDDRIRTCQVCENKDLKKWLLRTLWCSICKCFIPAKARIEKEKCPLEKWER